MTMTIAFMQEPESQEPPWFTWASLFAPPLPVSVTCMLKADGCSRKKAGKSSGGFEKSWGSFHKQEM
jgi:hypothetical protein